ncbi:hypothetical protein VNI00_003312 [Paramarasmius palmivorus]|uniref:Heterokaryon incompatibility domain-containing protein n=1 Tax=Paramarasmius palmivorus TaxID=297713 RepID=A0AAW0DU15_9AGAR
MPPLPSCRTSGKSVTVPFSRNRNGALYPTSCAEGFPKLWTAFAVHIIRLLIQRVSTAFGMKLFRRLQENLSKHYWDGKLRLKSPQQLVYSSKSYESSPEFVPITIPQLCASIPYDNAGFWDFPARVGWTIRRVDRQCHSGCCPPGICTADGSKIPYGLQVPAISKDKVAFMQAWLFFGALHEVCSLCGLVFDVNDLLVEGVVHTAWLNGLPMKLFGSARRRGTAGSKGLKVQLVITRGNEFDDEHAYTFSECQVLWSIHILLRTLTLAVLCHSADWFIHPKDPVFFLSDVSSNWTCEGEGRMAELMFERLQEKGWCKSKLHGLRNAMMFFRFFVERSGPHRIHVNCTETRCMASQTSEEDYKTVHTSDVCNCDFVAVDQVQLRDSLSRQLIPKVIISRHCELQVVKDEAYPYVAISHVWADGLGNPHANALPRCELQRLRNLIDYLSNALHLSASRPIAIWMDTLCIPVSPQYKEFRKLAIRLLAPTYRDANAVLVLDRQLCDIKSRDVSNLELGIRVISGGWMKRLWTLQEAALSIDSKNNPGKIYFQMSDGPICWDRANRTFRHVSSKRERALHNSRKPHPLACTIREIKDSLLFGLWIDTSITSRLPSVKDLGPAGWETQFQRLAYAVQSRTTSKIEDEAICLASLAGIDVSSILDISTTSGPMATGLGASEWTAEQRMRQLYLNLQEIPSSIIFLRNPALAMPDYIPTALMTDAPYRWAPRSLLLHQTEIMNIHNADAQRRFSDCDYRLNGVCAPDGLHIEHAGFLFLGDNAVITSSCSFEDADSKEVYTLTRYGATEVLDGRLALIFETSVISTAAIVAVEGNQEGELYVTIVGHGSVSLDERKERTYNLSGTLKARDQRWCIT